MESSVTQEEAVLERVVEIDEGKVRLHLDGLVRSTVEETLNGLLDAEADALGNSGASQGVQRSRGR